MSVGASTIKLMVMPFVIYIFLSAVLAVAGISKLTSLDHVISALAQFKLPDFLHNRVTAVMISLVELALAILILVSSGHILRSTLVATAVVFSAYFIAVARVMRESDGAQCGCFGKLSTMPIGPLMLVRNGIYVASALVGIVLVGYLEKPAIVTVFTFTALNWLLLTGGVLVIAGTVLTIAPALNHTSPEATTDAELLDYLEVPIPYGELETEDGETVALRDLPRQLPQLLIFALPDCLSCLVVLDQVEDWSERFAGVMEVKAVFLKSKDVAFQHYPNLKGNGLALFDIDHKIFSLLQMRSVPSAVLFGTNGLVSGGPVAGDEAVVEFVDNIAAELKEAGLL